MANFYPINSTFTDSGGVATVGQATETDTSLSATPAVPLGISTETDSGFAVGYETGILASQASETDSSLPLTFALAISLGLASETDSSLDIRPVFLRDIGLASETDSSIQALIGHGIGIEVASQTQSASTFSRSVGIIPGQSLETDAALSLSLSKEVATILGLGVEADTATPLTRHVAHLVGTAEEQDVALLLKERWVESYLAGEIDEAQPIGILISPTETIGIAQENTSTQSLQIDRVMPAPVVEETSVASPIYFGIVQLLQSAAQTYDRAGSITPYFPDWREQDGADKVWSEQAEVSDSWTEENAP